MQCTVTQRDLKRALDMVRSAVPTRGTDMPICQSVLLELPIQEGTTPHATLTGTDLVFGVQCSILCVQSGTRLHRVAGSVAVPFLVFDDLVGKFSAETILDLKYNSM